MSDATAAADAGKMSDLLSAASLLLTVLGIVYGSWYAEITSALSAPIPDNPPNRGPVRDTVRGALRGRAYPLASAAVVLTLVFFPDAVAIALNALHSLAKEGSGALLAYNAVQAAFCLVVVLSAALALYLVHLVCALKGKLREIGPP